MRTITWGRYDGLQIPIDHITDEHLANIIHHIHEYSTHYPVYVLEIMIAEAHKRNLTEDFLAQKYHYEGYEQCQQAIKDAGMRKTSEL